MKRPKLAFTRVPLLILLIILQLLLIASVAVFIITLGYLVIGYVATVIAILAEIFVFIRILNRDDAPDFKVPWFCIMMFMPIIGVLVYIFFANHGLRRKTRKFLLEQYNKQKPYKFVRDDIADLFQEYSLKYSNVNKYLMYSNDMRGFAGNKVTYYDRGEKFFPDFIKCLKEAKHFIFMEFFIIDHGKEWEQIHEVLVNKAKEGVEVRLLYDDFGCASTLGAGYVKRLREEGINAYRFNKFLPILNGLFNNRDHRKIAVIDHLYGFTGGMNLADEYANDIVRFGYWKDSMIKIEGPAITNLTNLFFQAFDSNRGELSDYKKYLSYIYKPQGNTLVFPFGDGPKPFYQDAVGEETFIAMLMAAKKNVYISTPYLIPTFALENCLINLAKSGVEINLIVPGIPDKKLVYMLAKSKFAKYINAGINIYTYTPGFNHQKSIVIDEEFAFVGTINFDYRSLIHHFECGAVMMGDTVIKEITDDLKQMVSDSNKVPADFKLHWFKRFICSIMTMFASLL